MMGVGGGEVFVSLRRRRVLLLVVVTVVAFSVTIRCCLSYVRGPYG